VLTPAAGTQGTMQGGPPPVQQASFKYRVIYQLGHGVVAVISTFALLRLVDENQSYQGIQKEPLPYLLCATGACMITDKVTKILRKRFGSFHEVQLPFSYSAAYVIAEATSLSLCMLITSLGWNLFKGLSLEQGCARSIAFTIFALPSYLILKVGFTVKDVLLKSKQD